MDTPQENRQAGDRMALSIAVWELRQAIQSCLMHKNVGRFCNVFVMENGPQLELSGTVDSAWTHAQILSMVPDEERCVVDRIRVIPRAESYLFAG